MASVTEIVPTPPPVPESTFNITGLTLDEMIFLRDLLGFTAGRNAPSYTLYDLLSEQLPERVHPPRFGRVNGVIVRS